jgi:hypothetical protein
MIDVAAIIALLSGFLNMIWATARKDLTLGGARRCLIPHSEFRIPHYLKHS